MTTFSSDAAFPAARPRRLRRGKALRRLVTPEMVSYLSEELANNAQQGVRNDVTDVHLLQADIAEAWNEGDRDYATAALNYSSIDVTRNRTTGEVVDGDAGEPTETTELWTFVRQNGGDFAAGKTNAGALVSSGSETCALCHGPGRSADVKTMHGVGSFQFN